MQPDSLNLRFRIGRIPVVVEPWFWVMAFVMGSHLRGPAIVLWVAVVFVSILVHELGHALLTRHFGASAWIRLHSFGGLTYPDRKLRRSQEIAMTAAGPFFGFGLAAIAFALLRYVPALSYSPVGFQVLQMVYVVNLWWGIINLLPVPPLDGGHIALAVGGPRRERAVRILAVAVAGAVVVWSLSEGAIYRAVLFGLLGYQNLQLVSRGRHASDY